MKEIWKEINGYEGYYKISSIGNVLSVNRSVYHSFNLVQIVKERILTQHIVSKYLRVTLTKNSKLKMITVHRLIAIAFIPNPENKPQVNHIDGNKLNNSIENLEWCTAKENNIHKYKVLNYKNNFIGTKGIIVKKPVAKIDPNTQLVLTTFNSLSDAAENAGVSRHNTRTLRNHIVKNKIYKNYIWKYI